MGFLDDVGRIADKIGLPNPADIVNGAVNGVNDARAFVGDVVEGDFHGALTNGRKLIGDAQDVIGGLGSLGVFPNVATRPDHGRRSQARGFADTGRGANDHRGNEGDDWQRQP
ncbi:hypothetical protein [Mycolicibacterium goodii]|uniref:hypothetical protein n=1 Tax=Mycolicibacterium goodii TaxID=134601 RepID=UPI000AFB0118